MRLVSALALLALASPLGTPDAAAQSGAPSSRDSVVIVTRGRTVVVEGAGDSAHVVLRREGRRSADTLRLRVPDVERLLRRVRVFEEDGESSVSLDSLARRTGRRWRARIDSLMAPSGDSLRVGAVDGVRIFRAGDLDGFRPHPEARDYDLLTLPGRDARDASGDDRDIVIERRIERRSGSPADAPGREREVVVRRRGDRAPVRVTVEGDTLRIVDEAGERTVRIPRRAAPAAPPAMPETRPDGTVVVPDAQGGVWIYVPPTRPRG